MGAAPERTADMTPARESARRAFLAAAGWGDAARAPLAGDASSRRYERLRRGADTAILMDAPPAAEAAACPPDADAAARRALGYNAMARLAGPDLKRFIAIAEALRRRGLSAPEIYAAEPERGLALLEDLGDDLFARAIPAGADAQTLYETATDLLAALHAAIPETAAASEVASLAQQKPPAPLAYDRLALETEITLFLDWYLPHAGGRMGGGAVASPDLRASYLAVWAPALAGLEAAAEVLVLRDFHAENLLWLPGRAGVARVGLLDFQDAVIGPAAYDLVSLLEDARRDVAPDLAAAMRDRYCAARAAADSDFETARFRAAYALCGAQRNAKILGIFMRLAHRDGKRRYLDLIGRVRRHLIRDLDHPALAEVRAWHQEFAPLESQG